MVRSELKINCASCQFRESDVSDSGFTRKIILPGEVRGMETFYVELMNGIGHDYNPEERKLRILLFLSGEGSIVQGDLSIQTIEPGLFVPDLHRKFKVKGGQRNLLYLEILMSLTAQDLVDLNREAGRLPHYMAYSEGTQYHESIKSKKTISRMILPENIVPRLCIGTVKTTGPDEVATHTHPMLEQLFLGLTGNDVTVIADEQEARFVERDLLHIPLGSSHGARVDRGKVLHYLWVDLFTHRSEMDYMKYNHIITDTLWQKTKFN